MPAQVNDVDQLFKHAQRLSEDDRAELAGMLFDTLPRLPEISVRWESKEEAEAAWDAEFQRRLDDVANGTADMLPLDEAFREIQAAFDRKHRK